MQHQTRLFLLGLSLPWMEKRLNAALTIRVVVLCFGVVCACVYVCVGGMFLTELAEDHLVQWRNSVVLSLSWQSLLSRRYESGRLASSQILSFNSSSPVHFLPGSSLQLVRSPPANKVIKTRYRIVKKNVASPSGSLSSFSDPIPSWKTRRLAGSR